MCIRDRFKPFALELFETIKLIDIGDNFVLENLTKDFKLLPAPEINTAVLILLIPVDRTI